MATSNPIDPKRQGTQIPALEIATWARAAGFTGDALVTATALALEESEGWTGSVNTNADQWKSRDRGLWQINDHWHPDVTDNQAFDPKQAAIATYRISAGGKDWSAWSAVPARTSRSEFAVPAKAAAAAAEARTGVNTTGAETDADPSYLHPATSLVWCLNKAGLSGSARTDLVAAAYYWNGKRDGFSWAGNANGTIWPAVTADMLAAVAPTQAELGALTGQAAIGARLRMTFGAHQLGAVDATSTAWAAKLVDQADKFFAENAGFSPFQNQTTDVGAATPIDPVGSAIDAVTSALSSPLAALQALVGFIVNPQTWIRLGLVLGGVAAIAGGLFLFANSTPTGHQAIKGAATAAAL